VGAAHPTNPRSAVNLATELFDSTGRGGMIWMVHKLYKVSDKSVSTFGFSTPGVDPKGPHPLSVEGVRHLATVASHQIVLFAEHGKDLEHSFATGVVFEGAVSLHEFEELLQGLFEVAAHH